MAKKFTHSGRAANCQCKKLSGVRCPDCNHVLTGETNIIEFGETDPIQHEEVRCTVCKRLVRDYKELRDVYLVVQDSKQQTLSNF